VGELRLDAGKQPVSSAAHKGDLWRSLARAAFARGPCRDGEPEKASAATTSGIREFRLKINLD
jgi:hypothetical protein